MFAKDYDLRPLSDVADFINENSHLPEVPSAAEIDEKGIDVAGMDAALLKKIEELTLYTIQQQEQLNLLTQQIQVLQNKLDNEK